MNPLTDVLPARWRKRLYALYALAGLTVGALAAGGLDVGTAPDVLAYLGIGLGVTAASNTRPQVEPDLVLADMPEPPI